MASADGHTGSFGDSSTGTPARGLQHGDSSTCDSVLVSNTNPSAVGADGRLGFSVSGNGPSLLLRQSASRLGVQAWFILAAIVLFLAVAAKLQWIWNNPLWEDIAIGGVWITLAAIVLEGWAAASILMVSRRNAAYIGLAMHVVLLVASAGFWISGQSCQCFGDWQLGAFKIPTWLLPIYNLIAIIFFAMIAIKPNQSTTIKSRLRLPDLGTQCGLALGLLTGLFMLSTAQGQQFWRSGAATNEVVLQVGEVPELVPGQSYETVVTLYNRLSKPIRVVGGGTSCTCVTLENIPLEIPANSRRELAVRFKVGEHLRGQKEFTSSLVYYLEGGQQFLVRGKVCGMIDNLR
ncbi:MAG: hypothetical protein JNK57_20425 [Planctomycetaceae bacterium]|nr:hypothetical protein [Planctomycetaceae bacterium]